MFLCHVTLVLSLLSRRHNVSCKYVSSHSALSLPPQDENNDDDDWNPCKAAGVCLMLLATCCEDDVVPHVLPFIKEHIKHPDWRYRDASVMAFGSILEGPELSQLKPLVIQVTNFTT